MIGESRENQLARQKRIWNNHEPARLKEIEELRELEERSKEGAKARDNKISNPIKEANDADEAVHKNNLEEIKRSLDDKCYWGK